MLRRVWARPAYNPGMARKTMTRGEVNELLANNAAALNALRQQHDERALGLGPFLDRRSTFALYVFLLTHAGRWVSVARDHTGLDAFRDAHTVPPAYFKLRRSSARQRP